jgi:hypothetical protein
VIDHACFPCRLGRRNAHARIALIAWSIACGKYHSRERRQFDWHRMEFPKP